MIIVNFVSKKVLLGILMFNRNLNICQKLLVEFLKKTLKMKCLDIRKRSLMIST